MTQSHWAGRSIPFGRKSTAFWAIKPDRKLLLFVHGFCGKALKTWDSFATLIQHHSKYAGYDVIFYGYDGFRIQASLSAARLHDFLNRFVTHPAQVINSTIAPSEHRSAQFGYDQIVLVGHSLGAIVVRRAVLDAYARARPWVSKAKMMFFAPAHSGANVVELASQALIGIPYVGHVLGPAIKYRGTVLQDLEPSSPMLTRLLADTQTAFAGGALYAVAAANWFGEYENVVSTVQFGPDGPPGPPIPRRGHLSVCKPGPKYLQPLTDLEAHL
jgi:predicted alpha/beta-fold hydrolase